MGGWAIRINNGKSIESGIFRNMDLPLFNFTGEPPNLMTRTEAPCANACHRKLSFIRMYRLARHRNVSTDDRKYTPITTRGYITHNIPIISPTWGIWQINEINVTRALWISALMRRGNYI